MYAACALKNTTIESAEGLFTLAAAAWRASSPRVVYRKAKENYRFSSGPAPRTTRPY